MCLTLNRRLWWDDLPTVTTSHTVGFLVEWDDAGSAPPTATVPQPASTGDVWVRKWNTPEEHDASSPLTIVDGWVVRKPEKTDASQRVGGAWRDGAIRAEMKWLGSSDNVLLRLRVSGEGEYELSRTMSGLRLACIPGDKKRIILKDHPLNEPKVGEIYSLEFRALGRTLTAKLDGREVFQVEDDKLTGGRYSIYLKGQASLRNIEVLNLDQPAAVSPSPAPQVSASSPSTATKDAPFVNTLGMKFVPVPITGGPTNGQRVLFSVWETRVQDYEVFATETKREWPKPDFEQGPTHPAVNVSWDDAQAFCTWLTERERNTGKLAASERYRLPGDHEWSCAVGIGDREDPALSPDEKKDLIENVYPWGTQWPPPAGTGNFSGDEEVERKDTSTPGILAGYRDDFPYTAPVGSFAPNALGLHDLAGNVREWCEDWVDRDQTARVSRGGSFMPVTKRGMKSSFRSHGKLSRQPYGGFRVVLAPVP
jgi:hypothetical protein